MTQVCLSIPGVPEYVAVARLTAAGVASRSGLAVDGIEDIRIAVDELCFLLLSGADPSGTIELTFTIAPGTLGVEGRLHGRTEAPGEISELSRQILSVVTDSFDTVLSNGQRSFRLTKQLEAVVA